MVSHLLVVILAAIGVSAFAERRNIQPALLLVMAGLAASYIPSLPRIELDPHIILSVVLPPLLYSAASEFSFVSFLKRLGSIVNLGVFLVIATTMAVGGIATVTIPGLSLAAAIVLAAVVAPPDAVAAVAIGRQFKLPARLMTLLKGESLINDAAALTLFSFAAAAVTGTQLAFSNIFVFLGYNALVGTLVGIVLGMLVSRVRVRFTNPSLVTVISVIVPFAAYRVAEELGASGVLAVVAAGLSVGHNATRAGFSARIQERQFWRTIDALLEAFIFAYIGLQLRWVLLDADAAGYSLPQVLWFSAIVFIALLAVRFAWIYATALLYRQRRRAVLNSPRYKAALEKAANSPHGPGMRRRDLDIPEPYTWKENIVLGWTGMRGVVTLAAAAGIPLVTASGAPFPGREIIQAVAFMVTIGTLLIQGLTLPTLIRRLNLNDPGEAGYLQTQRKLAAEVSRKGMRESLSIYAAQHPDAETRAAIERVSMRFGESDDVEVEIRSKLGPRMLEMGRLALEARRAALIKARDDRELDDEVLRELLEDLDIQQAAMANWGER